MICLPVIDKSGFSRIYQEARNLMESGKDAGMELRLDLIHFLEKDIADFPDLHGIPVILTYRCQERQVSGCSEETENCGACTSMKKLRSELIGSFEQLDIYYTEKLILALIDKGAGILDLGDEMNEFWQKRWFDLAKEKGCRIILSHHDFQGTERKETYLEFYRDAISRGADLVKIVTTARSTQEAISVLELYHDLPADRLIAFSMGEKGRFSRMEAWKYGSPITYVALDEASASASGQIDLKTFLKETDSDNYLHIALPESDPVSSETSDDAHRIHIRVPSSKSYAQRLIICSALSGKTTRLVQYTDCRDNRSALQIATRLQAVITHGEKGDGEIMIHPTDLPEGDLTLDIGESGLCTRIAIALGAFLKQTVTITGSGSVLKRSFEEECRILEKAGIEFTSDRYRLPISVRGHFPKGYTAAIHTRQSSQFASGLLIGMHFSQKTLGYPVDLRIETAVSAHYLEITKACLKKLSEKEIVIEGDWSSAANLCAAAILTGRGSVLENLSSDSLQPDSAILTLLKQQKFIVQTERRCGMDCLAIDRNDRPLEAFTFDAGGCPDLFPVLAVLALHCHGTSVIRGISRLTNKESNRLESIYCLLTEYAGNNRCIKVADDSLFINGIINSGTGQRKKLLFKSYNDHRIAMAALLLILKVRNRIPGIQIGAYVDNLKCLDKSYPDFISDLSLFR